MNKMDIPMSAWISLINANTWAWTVTSNAVVGSSAMSRVGSQHSAMAIITRWRMPPENSCGYALARRAALGMCTRDNISTARCLASFRDSPRWRRIVSAI